MCAQTYTVVADSLRLPTGLEMDGQGRLWIVESGYGFDDGAVSVLAPGAKPAPVIVGLASLFDTTTQETVGPWHTLALPGNRLAVVSGVAGGVYLFDLDGFIPGVTLPKSPLDSAGFFDIRGFVFQQGFKESDPYTATRDAAGDLYVADAAANAVVRVQPSGQMTVFDTFPPAPNPLPFGPPVIDAVPTRILAKPGGGFYLCTLTGFPFLDSAATIFSLAPNGAITPYAGGFTALTDLALDAATGDLYAIQLGKFDFSTFNFAPNTAKITRIRPNGDRTVVADNFDLGTAVALDGQGNLYAAELASGRVLKWAGVATATREQSSGLTAVALAPNPSTGPARLSFSLETTGPVRIQVLDAGGRVRSSQNLGVLDRGPHELELPVTLLPAGLYWVQIETLSGKNCQALLRSGF